MIITEGQKVVAVTAVPAADAMSINSRVQLSETSKIMQRRIQDKLMNSGVTIVTRPIHGSMRVQSSGRIQWLSRLRIFMEK